MTRIISGEAQPHEATPFAADKALRPQTLAEFVGQEHGRMERLRGRAAPRPPGCV